MRSIGEVADSLDLPQHVLRFWETRFKEIDPLKRAGGRRLYRQRDVDIVITIRHLLYSEGYTIKGVQRILKEQGVDAVMADVARRMAGDAPAAELDGAQPELEQDMPASDGDVDEKEAEAETPDVVDAEMLATPVDDPEPIAPPDPKPEPQPRPLNEEDARLLRGALAEIEECRRLLKLTIR